jgi:hypothetical protein
MSQLLKNKYPLSGKVKLVKKCLHESSRVGCNVMFSENRWHGHIFLYVLSNLDYLYCILAFWFNLPMNFDSLITSRNFLASPRNFKDRLTPQTDHSENHWSPKNSIFLKFQSYLIASKFDHKICMEDSKFISSGFRVDRWRFKKKLILPN